MERLRKLRDKLIILTQTMMFSLIILYSLQCSTNWNKSRLTFLKQSLCSIIFKRCITSSHAAKEPQKPIHKRKLGIQEICTLIKKTSCSQLILYMVVKTLSKIQYRSDDELFMQILYIEPHKDKFKKQLPESLHVQEDPEKEVRENWYKKERVNLQINST